MEKITDILKKKFTYSVEVVPPRNGSEVDIFKKLQVLKDVGIDFLSVTKGAGGSLRGGTVPISYFAQEKFGISTIAHFTCRETVKERIENNLIDLNYFNIKNILALRGDPPDMQEDYVWEGSYKYAYNLVNQINKMNHGEYVFRKGFDEGNGDQAEGKKTDFCIGVAAHPEEPNGNNVKYLKKKVEEGADFAITQMIFDVDIYKKFLKDLRAAGVTIPVIPGIWPLDVSWKLEQAEEKFKATIPKKVKEFFKDVKDKKEFREKGIEWTANLCRDLQKAGAPGIHLFLFLDVEIAKEIFNKIR